MTQIPLQAVPEPNPENRTDTTGASSPADPFDPANLRLSQAFTETTKVTKLLTTVPVRKPGSQDFVRVHPLAEFREDFPVIELKEEREEYIVTAGLVSALANELVTKTLYTAVNRQGVVSLWPVRLPFSDGRDLDWWRTAREAAELARRQWIRIKSNTNLGAYEIYLPESVIPEPEWPQLGYWDLIKIAFRDRLIDREDHPVIQRLRGRR
jgi:hypothetical protein